jgi:hypothetical protein
MPFWGSAKLYFRADCRRRARKGQACTSKRTGCPNVNLSQAACGKRPCGGLTKAGGRCDHDSALRPASMMLQAGLNSVTAHGGSGGTDMAGFGPAVVASIPLLPPLERGLSGSVSCALEPAAVSFLPETDMTRTSCRQVHSPGTRKHVRIQTLERPLRAARTRGAPVSSGIRSFVCKRDRWSW